jgi:hypothetical protein
MAGFGRSGPFGLHDEPHAPPEFGGHGGLAPRGPLGLDERDARLHPGATPLAHHDFDRDLQRPNGVSFWFGAQEYRVRQAGAKAPVREEQTLTPDEVRALLDRVSRSHGDPGVPVALLEKATAPSRASVVVLRLRPLPAAASKASAAADMPSAPPPRPTKLKEGWIEIEVVDDTGKPVTGRAYKLQLPDGRTLEGKLGSNGTISVHAIDPGSCTFTLMGS